MAVLAAKLQEVCAACVELELEGVHLWCVYVVYASMSHGTCGCVCDGVVGKEGGPFA